MSCLEVLRRLVWTQQLKKNTAPRVEQSSEAFRPPLAHPPHTATQQREKNTAPKKHAQPLTAHSSEATRPPPKKTRTTVNSHTMS